MKQSYQNEKLVFSFTKTKMSCRFLMNRKKGFYELWVMSITVWYLFRCHPWDQMYIIHRDTHIPQYYWQKWVEVVWWIWLVTHYCKLLLVTNWVTFYFISFQFIKYLVIYISINYQKDHVILSCEIYRTVNTWSAMRFLEMHTFWISACVIM